MATGLKLVRGDTNKINLLLRRPRLDSSGQQLKDNFRNLLYDPVDLTGAELWLTARDAAGTVVLALDSTAPGVEGSITFNAPTTLGTAVAIISPAATVALVTPMWLNYDVQLVEADGTRTTVARGQLVVSTDVTIP